LIKMADVQYWEDTLREELEDIQGALKKAERAKPNDRGRYLSRADKKIRSAQGTKRSFKMETRLVSDPGTRKDFENRLGRLNEELSAAVADARALRAESERGELMEGSSEKSPAQREVDGVKQGDNMLNEARQTQDKTQQSLNRTKQMVAESKEVGVSTLEELGRQRDQIDRIDNDADRMVDNLERSQKLIRHFGKRMATDKFVQLFAVINVLLLVGVVVYAVFWGGGLTGKDDGDGAPADPVRMLRG